jgi:hypothetical protein
MIASCHLERIHEQTDAAAHGETPSNITISTAIDFGT